METHPVVCHIPQQDHCLIVQFGPDEAKDVILPVELLSHVAVKVRKQNQDKNKHSTNDK